MLFGINGPIQAGAGGGYQQVYAAKASVTALPAYTATALGGPLLYNGSTAGGGKGVTAYVLFLSYGLSTASTVAGSIGIAGGATNAPSSTTAIGLSGNINPAAKTAACSVYSTGTVSAAATFYLPTGQVGTGAVTVMDADDNSIHLGGLIVVPPGYFAAPAAGAALTTSVLDIGLVWLEVTND